MATFTGYWREQDHKSLQTRKTPNLKKLNLQPLTWCLRVSWPGFNLTQGKHLLVHLHQIRILEYLSLYWRARKGICFQSLDCWSPAAGSPKKENVGNKNKQTGFEFYPGGTFILVADDTKICYSLLIMFLLILWGFKAQYQAKPKYQSIPTIYLCSFFWCLWTETVSFDG